MNESAQSQTAQAEPTPPPRRRLDPLFAAVLLVAAGVAVITMHQLRAGLYIVAAGLGAAAVFRLLLRPRAAGSLVVRSRQADVIVLAGLAVAIAVLAALTPLAGASG